MCQREGLDKRLRALEEVRGQAFGTNALPPGRNYTLRARADLVITEVATAVKKLIKEKLFASIAQRPHLFPQQCVIAGRRTPTSLPRARYLSRSSLSRCRQRVTLRRRRHDERPHLEEHRFMAP